MESLKKIQEALKEEAVKVEAYPMNEEEIAKTMKTLNKPIMTARTVKDE